MLRFGFQRHAYKLRASGKFATLPLAWKAQDPMQHFIYCPSKDSEINEVALHSAPTQLTETAYMRFLHSCGYLRAVLLMGERDQTWPIHCALS